jgi:hypothetical protein
VGEVKLPDLPLIKSEIEINLFPFNVTNYRRAQKFLNGPGFISRDLTLHRPHPDTYDAVSTLAGALKRFACKPPTPKEGFWKILRDTTYRWCVKHLTPLEIDTDLSDETWYSKTSYTEERINEFRKIEIIDPFEDRNFDVDSFTKEEEYDTYKYPRGINARNDRAKKLLGPIFKAIEEVVFKNAWFIKKVPIADRPRYIRDILFNGKKLSGVIEGDDSLFQYKGEIAAGDYTAYEAHFVKLLMESCEFVMYDFMIQNLANKDYYHKLLRRALLDTNVIKNVFYIMYIEATRMSGEMNTSLGNGFSNLMLIKTLCKLLKRLPTEADFLDMGITCKLQKFEQYNEASFCGLIFDPLELSNIADPIKILINFGWSDIKYINAKPNKKNLLVKIKALSFLYQYPGCPIVQEFAYYILRTLPEPCNTRITRSMFSDSFKYEQFMNNALDKLGRLKQIVYKDVGINTRFLMEKIFGISVENQIAVENYFKHKNVYEDFSLYHLEHLIPFDTYHYSERYVIHTLNPDTNYPVFQWNDKFPIVDPNGYL